METQERERRTRKSNGRHGAEAKSLDQRKLLRALQAVRDGDFSARLASDQTGLAGKVADTFNEIVASNQRLARELERAGQIVGKDGKTRHRMASDRRSGAWGAMEGSVNTLIDDLLWPTAEVTRTISAVAKGDLQQTMSLEVAGRPLKGEFLRSATIVNSMIEQMSAFTSEVTRVAREVGTEGKLGGQAAVLALGTHFARHARDLGGEGAHLLDHRVDDRGGSEEFSLERPPSHFQAHGLLQVALGDRGDGACDFRSRPQQVIDEGIHRPFHRAPGTGAPVARHAMTGLAVLADDLPGTLQLARQALIGRHDLVECIGYFA